jgi:predicted tellurium resistance membrane protein TerC
MAIVMFGGSIFAELIDRLWWLAYAGALVIAWTGADMVQDDDLLQQVGSFPPLVRPVVSAIVSLIVVAVAWRFQRYQTASRQSAQ